jgi:hypothetical protein
MATHRPFVGTFATDLAPEWERQSGVIAVYEASPRPVWTTEPPTHPGVWWIRLKGHAGRVVEVYSQTGHLFYEWTDIEPQPVPRATSSELEWSSRAITEPG